MKHKCFAGMLALLMSLSLISCGAERPPALSVDTESRLKTVAMLPATRIPETGWDEDSIAYTIYINGSQHRFPTTLSQCGSLFTIADDSAFTFSDDGIVTGHLLYEGCMVGSVKLKNCASESAMYDGTIKSLTFTAPNAGDGNIYPSMYPISINHVTIGSTAEEISNLLGFDVPAGGTINVAETIGRYQIILKGNAEKGVTEIILIDQNS